MNDFDTFREQHSDGVGRFRKVETQGFSFYDTSEKPYSFIQVMQLLLQYVHCRDDFLPHALNASSQIPYATPMKRRT